MLLAGFAAADAFRGEGAPTPPPATGPAGEEASSDDDPAPGERRATRLPPVPGTSGVLVFTDNVRCALREVALPGATEFPSVVASSSCDLWAAPVSAKVAYGIGSSSEDTVPFRLIDLTHPNRNLGGYRALFGFIVWSHDGQRVAWCGGSRAGFDLEPGGEARRLPQCPAAYTPENEIAYAVGDRLVVEDRTILRASGGITYAAWGSDGSLALGLDGRRLERFADGRRTHALDLPRELHGRLPRFSPDSCAALFRRDETIHVVDIGCFAGVAAREYRATAAAWSPDGEWIVLAERETIAFHRVVEPRRLVRWPVGASQLAWRR